MTLKLYLGDCIKVSESLDESSIDTCITDPPYELGFMDKDWDSAGVSFQKETWEAVYRVLKPGALLLSFGGTRTWHRIAVAIEDAGFDIRDTIYWMYGQGFPKSYNIGKGIDKRESELAKEWKGWGTALKPAVEPIIVAMKPIEGSYVNNALTHGVAGMWIDGAKIPLAEGEDGYTVNTWDDNAHPFGDGAGNPYTGRKETKGRWPANVVLDEEAAEQLGENSRFFYCAKANKKERNLGCDELEGGEVKRQGLCGENKNPTHKNTHPTVTPLALMEYLCKLTRTPTGGIVLDPFMGSVTTVMACLLNKRNFIGIELERESFDIADKRIRYVANGGKV